MRLYTLFLLAVLIFSILITSGCSQANTGPEEMLSAESLDEVSKLEPPKWNEKQDTDFTKLFPK